MKAVPGPFPLVVTAEERKSSHSYQFDGPAVCVPLVSSTGHGHASINRLHFQEGRFALANIMLALLPRDPVLCNAEYLYWLLTARKDELLVPLMQGTSNVALREADVANVRITLPPPAEQVHVVKNIKKQFGKVDRVRRSLTSRDIELERLIIALAHRDDLSPVEKSSKGWRRVRLGEVMQPHSVPVSVRADQSYPNLGVLSFARGLFAKPPISGLDTSASILYRVKAGQAIYSRLFAFEGAYAYVAPEFDGLYVSNEFPTFTTSPEDMLAEFFFAYMKRPATWEAMKAGSKGLGDRRQRVQPETILKHELWLPPITEQRRIVSALAAHRAVAGDRTQEERLIALERSILNTELGLR